MRFGNVILGYFVIGALMWGGGVIAWDDAGVAQMFVDDPTNPEPNEERQQDVQGIDGRISQIVGSFASALGLFAVWNILVKFVAYLFWPITVLNSVAAPPRIVVLLGGALTTMFHLALLRAVRGSS